VLDQTGLHPAHLCAAKSQPSRGLSAVEALHVAQSVKELERLRKVRGASPEQVDKVRARGNRFGLLIRNPALAGLSANEINGLVYGRAEYEGRVHAEIRPAQEEDETNLLQHVLGIVSGQTVPIGYAPDQAGQVSRFDPLARRVRVGLPSACNVSTERRFGSRATA
jgi:hypothetical protein